MNRVFKSGIWDNGVITINGDDAHHLSTVLRVRNGDEVVVCDGCSNDYICKITEISRNEIMAEVIRIEKNLAENRISITLFQSMPKSDKMDFVIQKAVELGVNSIVPVITEYSVIRNISGNRIERCRKISEAAAKQSGRGIIPEIHDAVNLDGCIDMMRKLSLPIVAYEFEKQGRLRTVLTGFCGSSIGILIGPEGGFSDTEFEKLVNNGIHSVTLGPRILKVDTAVVSAVTIINHELGL